jgi:hypothetical protein
MDRDDPRSVTIWRLIPKLASNSWRFGLERGEATIKRHYREVFTPEQGETWFKMGIKFTPASMN